MTLRLDGRVAVVTGAGRGLGRSYALELARRGAAVTVNDLGTADGTSSAPRVVDEIRSEGGEATASEQSIGEPESAAALIADTIERYGRLDVLINNAGITSMTPFESHELADFDALWAVHVRGPFVATQHAYRQMSQQGYGRVVFTSSAAGIFGRKMGGGYSVAKAALMGMMNVVSLEGKERGILANAVLPSATTEIKGFSRDALSESILDSLDRLKPLAAPEYVTSLIAYLASEECSVTHRMYSVVGGRYARVAPAVSEGWLCPVDEGVPSVEAVSAHFEAIDSTDSPFVPNDLDEEFAHVARLRTS